VGREGADEEEVREEGGGVRGSGAGGAWVATGRVEGGGALAVCVGAACFGGGGLDAKGGAPWGWG